MRKSSKLLAVLLTLCLMFGAITAIFVSATNGEQTHSFSVTEDAGNDYYATVSFHNDSRSKSQYYYYKNANGNVTHTSGYDLRDLSAVTVDFDIDTSNFTETTSTVNLRARTAIVKVGETGFLGGGNKFKELTNLTVKLIDGVPYLTDGTTNVPLPKDELTHITTVIYAENKVDADNTVIVYQKYFVNGEPFFSLQQQISEITYIRFAALYIGQFTEDKTITGTNAIVLNNIAINHYATSDTTLNPYKVDGLPTASIYEAEKVVYTATYNKTALGIADKYAELGNGDKIYISSAKALAKGITNDSTITIKGMKFSGVEVPGNVAKFTVKLEDGATFDLSEESKQNFVQKGDVYIKKNLSYANDTINGKVGTVDLNGKDGSGTDGTTLGWAYNNSAKSPYVSATHYENSYTRIHYQAGALKDVLNGKTEYETYMEREAEISWRANNKYNADYDLTNKKYMTIDFDFGTDSYAYTFTLNAPAAGQRDTYYATAATEAEAVANVNAEWGEGTLTAGNYTLAGRDLAYPTSADGKLVLRLQFVISDKEIALPKTISVSSNYYWYWDETSVDVTKGTDGVWSLVGAGGKVKLSNEIGVYDHITFVCEVTEVSQEVEGVECDTTVIVPHVYINGDYAFDAKSTTGIFTDNKDDTSAKPDKLYGDKKQHAADYVMFQQFMVQFGKNLTGATTNKELAEPNNPGFKMYDRYSLIFDNMTITYYDEVDLYNTTLDESQKNKEPLYTLENVVYNEDYETPNTGIYATIEGDETNKKYYVVGAAFNNAEGKTVNLHNAKYYTYSGALKNFTVDCDENSEFDMSSKVGWRYVKNGDSYLRVFDGELLANLSLTSGRFEFNIYLPLQNGIAKNSISAQAYTSAACTAKDNNIKSANYSTFNYKGVDYFVITWNARTDMTGEKKSYFDLKYTVEGNTSSTLDIFNGVFDPIAYMTIAAENALASAKVDGVCGGSEETRLIKAMMDYKVAALNYIEQVETYNAATEVATIKAFYELYEGHDACCGNYEREDKNLPVEDQYINIGAAHSELNLPDGISVAVAADSSSQNVYLAFKASQFTVFEVTYKHIKGETKTATYGTGIVVESESGNEYITLISGLEMADIDNEFSVVVYKGAPVYNDDGALTKTEKTDEKIGEFLYSLADYDVSGNTLATKFAKAIQNLAVVAENYKKYIQNTAN